MDNKTYILLKDTPELKAGDEFIYTLSHGSYAYFKDGNPDSKHWFFVECVHSNSEWFKEKIQPTVEDERIEVKQLNYYFGDKDGVSYSLLLNGIIPEEKYEAVKKAISDCLNNEGVDIVSLLRDCVSETWCSKSFDETQRLFDKFLVSRKLLPPTPNPITKGQSLQEDGRDFEVVSVQKDDKIYHVKTDGMCGVPLPYQWYLANGGKIHSVKRSSDGEIFSMGDFIKVKEGTRKGWSDPIQSFLITTWKHDAKVIAEFETWRQPLNDVERMHKEIKVTSPHPIPETVITQASPYNTFTNEGEKIPRCGMCGGETVLIRGKYPGTDKRNVCPTCTIERLEQIQEISSKDYGQTCKSNN